MDRNRDSKKEAVKTIKKGNIIIGIYGLRESILDYCGECSSHQHYPRTVRYAVYRIDLPTPEWKGYCCHLKHAVQLAKEVISVESRVVVQILKKRDRSHSNLRAELSAHKKSAKTARGRFTSSPNNLRYKTYLPRGVTI